MAAALRPLFGATRGCCRASPVSLAAAAGRINLHRPALPQALRKQRCGYHSYDHPPSSRPFGEVEEVILAAAYKHVPEHGFSQKSLLLGSEDAGYLDISPSFMSDSTFSLIRYHLVTQRRSLKAHSSTLFGSEDAPQPPSSQPDVHAKVAALTWKRLLGNKDVVHRWQEALAIMAQPSHLPESLKELAALSDEIWFLAGDKAVDPTWYTKRAALSMVYSSSELFMTNDRSPGFVETSQFVERRLGEVRSLGGAVEGVGQWVGFTLNAGVNVLRSKGVPI